MGSVYKRGDAFYLRYRDGAGVLHREATTAKTKAAADKLLAEVAGKAQRQKLGLEAAPVESSVTLAELCGWWLDNRCPETSVAIERFRLGAHVMRSPMGQLLLHKVTPEILEQHFERMGKATMAAASINKLRSILHAVFAAARRPDARKWIGPNPVADTRPREVRKRVHFTIRAEEVSRMVLNVPEYWRGFFACAIYLGLRKGEIAGLLKTSVDLDAGVLFVRNSWETDTTKGKRVDGLPIPAPLMPYLRRAMNTAPGAYVFPHPSGAMRRKDSSPQKVLRAALKRAGLVDGYEHSCRRCKAFGRKQEAISTADCDPRRCDACGMTLWAKAIPRKMNFHDLRHSCATILLRAGVSPAVVQRIIRHANINTTIGTYGHLLVEDLRGAMDVFGEQSTNRTQGTVSNISGGRGK